MWLCPLPARAVELPQQAEKILSQTDPSWQDPANWNLDRLLGGLLDVLLESWGTPLRFVAQAVTILLLGCACGLLIGSDPGRHCVEAVCVLSFGVLSLSAMGNLLTSVVQTAESCQHYLISFIPVYSGVAAAGGQTGGATVYSTMFLAMSNFLAWAIRVCLLPVMQIYFCFSLSASIWNNPGMEEAARLFARCLHVLLKGCGVLFSLVLGMQSVLAGAVDSTAIRMGRSVLSGAIPVVGDAAAAALTSAAGAVQLLKGSLALAAIVALAGVFLPVFIHCLLYYLAFCGAGIVAWGSGQSRCGQICRTFSAGAQLCCSMLLLYFFMVFLSTALLLLTGTGGG